MPRTTLGMQPILAAHRVLREYLSPSRFVMSPYLSELISGEVWLKLECQQPTGSFKVRGAINKLKLLSQHGLSRGVVTGSAGNHGLGVAFAGSVLGIEPITIFVPGSAPGSKLAKLARFPVEVIKAGSTYEDAHVAAVDFAEKNGAAYIPAYDDVDVIAGQGTAGLEMMWEVPALDQVIVPVGGGGLIAGIASAVKDLNLLCGVIGVQAAASPSALLSFERGEPLDPYDHEPTIADGLAGGFGAVPFYLVRALIDRIELAKESELERAILTLLEHDQLVAEASGAAAIVPLLHSPADFDQQKVACVISGGNLDFPLLKRILKQV